MEGYDNPKEPSELEDKKEKKICQRCGKEIEKDKKVSGENSDTYCSKCLEEIGAELVNWLEDNSIG